MHADDELAVMAVLRTMPETWTALSPARTRATAEAAIRLLVDAGLVERRHTRRLQFGGEVVELEISGSGEAGLRNATLQSMPHLGRRWRRALKAWSGGNARDGAAVVVDDVPPIEVRLSALGVMARGDLEFDFSAYPLLDLGCRQRVLDFVFKRGPFQGRRSVDSDGTLHAFRVVAEGAGSDSPARTPIPVVVANPDAIGRALHERLRPVGEVARRDAAALAARGSYAERLGPTVSDLSEELSRHGDTIRRWCHAAGIRFGRGSRNKRLSPEELAALAEWLESSTVQEKQDVLKGLRKFSGPSRK